MNILIVKLSPIETITSSMFRTLAIARGLQEAGNEVDMLVVPYNGMTAVANQKDFIDKIRVIRTGKNEAYAKLSERQREEKKPKWYVNVIKQIWHKLSVYDYTYSIIRNLRIDILPRKKYDIVISSSDPKTAHLAVERFARQGLKYGKWIEYWGDPLALDITRVNIWPKYVLKRIEERLIKNADKIVYVSPFTLKEQKKLFPKMSAKMTFLPVAYMDEEVFPKTDNRRFVIGYYGNYEQRVRNLIPLYNACNRIGQRVDATFYGDSDMVLESTDSVHVFPRGIVDAHKARADLLVCVLNSSGTQIPGKLYHLAGTNKKVLVIVDGEYADEMKSYLESFDRFYICDNNEESIVNKIEDIIEDKRTFEPTEDLRYDRIAEELIK